MYWLQPPVEIDPEQTLIYLPGKNPLRGKPLQHGSDGLDQRDGDDPKPDYPHDDYRN